MDSLMSSADDVSPVKYMSKIYLLPHLNAVMCGTGLTAPILEWFRCIQAECTALNILELDEAAKIYLPSLKSAYKMDESRTATLYQFGFDSSSKKFKGFAYRSEKGFKSERLAYGVHVKPYDEEIHAEIEAGEIQYDGFADLAIKVISRQKILDSEPGRSRRVGIGGEIHVLEASDGCQTMCTCYRFADYEDLCRDNLE